MPQILLLEDDPVLGRGLKLSLELEGYEVAWAQDLRAAKAMRAQAGADLFLLDWNLPDGTGVDFCKVLRQAGDPSPVIFLTARTDEESAIKALSEGANDFVRKPFQQGELFMRIKVALRETRVQEEELRYKNFKILLKSRKAFFNKDEIELNRREFDIFVHLIKHAEQVVSREDLLHLIDKDGQIFDRTVDSHLSHLRARLKTAGVTGARISSVYGVGYRLEAGA